MKSIGFSVQCSCSICVIYLTAQIKHHFIVSYYNCLLSAFYWFDLPSTIYDLGYHFRILHFVIFTLSHFPLSHVMPVPLYFLLSVFASISSVLPPKRSNDVFVRGDQCRPQLAPDLWVNNVSVRASRPPHTIVHRHGKMGGGEVSEFIHLHRNW